MIKKFNEYSKFNEGFDFLKDMQDEYARKNTYENRVKDNIKSIVEDVNHISEKAFSLLKKSWKDVDDIYGEYEENISENIKKYKDGGKREKYCAEFLYDLYFKGLVYDADKFYKELNKEN